MNWTMQVGTKKMALMPFVASISAAGNDPTIRRRR